MSIPEWMEQGACTELPTAMFYPETNTGLTAAKKVCSKCPVLAECLAHALGRREAFGVWGGTSERERRPLLAPPARRIQQSPKTAKVRQLAEAGWTDPEIARELHCWPETVCRVRRKAGIPAGKWVLTRRSLGRTG